MYLCVGIVLVVRSIALEGLAYLGKICALDAIGFSLGAFSAGGKMEIKRQ